MILISHRGNLTGPNPETENSPEQVKKVIELGYDCEVDLWYYDKQLYLGHDKPQYKIDMSFLTKYDAYLWCHAKNIDALIFLASQRGTSGYYLAFTSLKFFWHEEDDYALVSNHLVWSHPSTIPSIITHNRHLMQNMICVLPEKSLITIATPESLKEYYGICSDHIEDYK